MSEISTYISSSPTVPVRPGSPGKPQPGRAVRILEDGQIGVHRSDPGLFLRYWGEEPPAGEWFATGDMGEIDADGYVWHHGRADDLMNAGGFRVSPLEVEAVLLQHPACGRCGGAGVAGVGHGLDHRRLHRAAAGRFAGRGRRPGVCQGEACRL